MLRELCMKQRSRTVRIKAGRQDTTYFAQEESLEHSFLSNTASIFFRPHLSLSIRSFGHIAAIAQLHLHIL